MLPNHKTRQHNVGSKSTCFGSKRARFHIFFDLEHVNKCLKPQLSKKIKQKPKTKYLLNRAIMKIKWGNYEVLSTVAAHMDP